MTMPTSDSAWRRRLSPRISTRVAFARVFALLLLIPITALWGVATVVLLELARSLLWFGVFLATDPRNMPIPVLGSGRYWTNITAWGHSVVYGDMYVHVVVLLRNMWNTKSPGFVGVVAIVHFVCALWIFTLVLRHRARRIGLRTFSNQPSRAWFPTLKYTVRCLGHVCLCQTVMVVLFLSGTKALMLCFYVGFKFQTQGTSLWPEAWQTSVWRKFNKLSDMLPQAEITFAILIGIIYSIIACERLAREAVRAEYRRTVSHCRQCGYPISRGDTTCPECGPIASRVRGSVIDATLKWISLPPRWAFLQIAGMILIVMGIQAAYLPSINWILVSPSPGRPLPPVNEYQFHERYTQLIRHFDYVAMLRLDTEYSLRVDGTNIRMQISSPIAHANYTRAIQLTWSVEGGPDQTALFPGYDPMRPAGDVQTEWGRFPVVYINDNVLFFQIGADIAFDAGPDRVDVRIFADSVSIDLANPTP